MKIGILSDTHSLNLPSKMLDGLKGVDLIIHAGDICDADVLKALEKIAPVKAVQGNMDDAALKKKLPLKELIEADGVKVGICHGHMGRKGALGNAQDIFKEDQVNVVVYGHSHQPLAEKCGSVLYFNPGSPNDAIRAPYFSYGLLEISNGKVKHQIIKI